MKDWRNLDAKIDQSIQSQGSRHKQNLSMDESFKSVEPKVSSRNFKAVTAVQSRDSTKITSNESTKLLNFKKLA